MNGNGSWMRKVFGPLLLAACLSGNPAHGSVCDYVDGIGAGLALSATGWSVSWWRLGAAAFLWLWCDEDDGDGTPNAPDEACGDVREQRTDFDCEEK